jgi:hypothetical protein
MLRSIEGTAGKVFAHDPSLRGYHVVYRPGEVNHCPACGRSHWYIGRLSAECGFCSAALPLVETGMVGTGVLRRPTIRYDEAA